MPKARSGESIRSKITRLRESLDREVNLDVFVNPSKYLKRLSLEKIVADTKVYRQGVERYKEKIVKGENIAPMIVVKHPIKDVYAVLDGHHRYYAYIELGKKEVECAVAGDFSSVIFYMTQLGLFQPHSEITEHIRVPALQFNENVKQFLSDFLKDPYLIEKMMNNYITRIRNSLSS
ncbi:MAG: ParB/RepB/Spo0J family partition protein [Candidatus Bathyarchaeota archaeon]